MIRIERILCPVDFSDFSAKAYDYAYSLALHYDARLVLLHVVQPLTAAYPYYAFADSANQVLWTLNAEAEKNLRELVQAHPHNGLPPELIVHGGLVTESILMLAQKRAIDLIVMGTHGTRGIDRLLIGSVTERVLRKASCPVLAVRKPGHDFVAPEDGTEPVRLRKILFCTDFSEHSERALDYASYVAMEYNAELTLLHVLDGFPASGDLQMETAKVIRRLAKPIPLEVSQWCALKFVVRVGKPYQEIIQLALESQADLVIMGVRGRNALDLALFGSTTHRVIQLGPSPVLAVHL